MCQLSYVDLKDNSLNKQLFLLLSSFGSTVHKDGWGIANSHGEYWKCNLPAWGTINSGDILKNFLGDEYSPLMGHIRLASPQIPVTDENAHPFRSKNGNILFMHNGKLTPKEEKNFVMDRKIETLSEKGVLTTKWEKISDSIIFFNRLQEVWTEDKTFYKALQDTMEEFYGKFAFMFYHSDSKKFNIVRGKTADLHVCYLLNNHGPDAKSVGYVVNTSKDLLDVCTTALANLHMIQTGKELIFSTVSVLNEETIYEAGEADLIKVGELKENEAYKAASFFPARGRSVWGDEEDDYGAGSPEKPVTIKTKEALLAEEIYNFMQEFSLSLRDIYYIIFKLYNASSLEIDEILIQHFIRKILPRFRSQITKDIRKKMKRESAGGFVNLGQYSDPNLKEKGFTYPWILSSKEGIEAFFNKMKD